MKGSGLKCYNKHTGKQTGWPPCRNDDVLPGDLSNNLKNKAKKNCGNHCVGLIKIKTKNNKKNNKKRNSYVKSLKVTGVNALNKNSKHYYTKVQPKLHNNRKKRTNLNYKMKVNDFDKFSCRWQRSLDSCHGCDGEEKYCVGDGRFCLKRSNKEHCTDKGLVKLNPEAMKAYWTQAPNFIGDTSLRTCSGTPKDFSLTQDTIKNKCRNLHNKNKNKTEGWIYNIKHVNRSNNSRVNTKKISNNNKKH